MKFSLSLTFDLKHLLEHVGVFPGLRTETSLSECSGFLFTKSHFSYIFVQQPKKNMLIRTTWTEAKTAEIFSIKSSPDEANQSRVSVPVPFTLISLEKKAFLSQTPRNPLRLRLILIMWS